MKLTIGDMFTEEFAIAFGDVDIFSDYTDEVIPAFCGPMRLTNAGALEWRGVLNVPIYVRLMPKSVGEGFFVCVACEDYVRENPALFNPKFEEDCGEIIEAKVVELFKAAAGYCSEENYNLWFIEV